MNISEGIHAIEQEVLKLDYINEACAVQGYVDLVRLGGDKRGALIFKQGAVGGNNRAEAFLGRGGYELAQIGVGEGLTHKVIVENSSWLILLAGRL